MKIESESADPSSAPPAFDMVAVARGQTQDADGDFATSLHRVALWPTKWRAYVEAAALNWRVHRLSAAERPAVPTDEGVYTLLVQPGLAGHPAASFLMYVGKANNLRRRFGDYLQAERRQNARPKNYRRLIRYSDHLWFCCAPLPGASDQLLRTVEDGLLVAYVPAWNDQLPAEISGIVKAFR